MEYGFVKVAAATPEIRVADAKYNAEQIIRLIRAAESEDVQLLVFPELCVTGYTCGELFSQHGRHLRFLSGGVGNPAHRLEFLQHAG